MTSQRHHHTLLTKQNNTRQKRICDLLRHLPTFMFRFLRLLSFVFFLLPAFLVFLYHYFACDRIAVYYGLKGAIGENGERMWLSRHYLDMYGSRTHVNGNKEKKPAVIFLTGGAWIIGYRMWGCLLARALVPFGILVIIPDYRNFPKVNIKGMVDDVDMSIQWVLDHVEEYGGDGKRVVLVGQSAGAHIGGVVVAKKVLDWIRQQQHQQQQSYQRGQGDNEEDCRHLKSTYSPQQLCGFITTSSPHNLVTMRSVFHRHGLSASVQRSIFGGISGSNDYDDDLNDDTIKSVATGDDMDVFEAWSPYHLVKKCQSEYITLISDGNTNRNNNDNKSIDQLKEIFPKLCVIHGTADKTVPVEEAIEFLSLLSNLQIPALSKMYPGWSHTDPILEKPMLGNHLYHRDIYEMVRLWTGGSDTVSDEGLGFCNGNIECNSEHKSEIAEIIGIVDDSTKAVEDDLNLRPFDETHSILRPICPTTLVEIARVCNPF
mmetsp:Transcript_18928/g.28814  ORF Transcript_18928/g.28814 Transcript_18928/m.28814 type:complete len:487 (-) Transcript_18928:721-2181(-)